MLHLFVESIKVLGGLYAIFMISRYVGGKIIKRQPVSSGATTVPMSGSKRKWFLRPAFLIPVVVLIGGLVAVERKEIAKHLRSDSSPAALTEAPAAESESATASAAPASNADECSGCKVEKVPNDQLTAEKQPNGKWKFVGHKCAGANKCAASCQVANCFSPSDDVEPTGCDRCAPGK